MTEKKEKRVFDITTLDTYALLSLFMGILSEQAWQHMGLRVKPRTDKVEKDLEKARVAIDCVEFLIGKLEPYISTEEKNRLKWMLTDLQINFARIQGEKG